MMIRKIERADALPVILYWLSQMKVNEIIDNIYKAHTNRDGLTYGQLSVLFVTYVIHSLSHRLSGMEEWLINHKTVIERITGRELSDNDATDDRLGRMLGVLGEDADKSTEFQVRTGHQIIAAYELPTDIARYDTTSFNVYHQSDSLYCRLQGSIRGNPCDYCREGGHYLFPLPMTGDIPAILKESVPNPPEKPQEIILSPKAGEEDESPRNVGVGFVTETLTEGVTDDGITHKWQERQMITLSDAHSQRQKKGMTKKKETADTFPKRAESILKD